MVARETVDALARYLRSETGVEFTVADIGARAGIELEPIPVDNVVASNASADVMQKSSHAGFPRICVYCERLRNLQLEKFRTFSGRVELAIEVRISQDRLEGLEERSLLYVEAIISVLEAVVGDWGRGMVYGGGYDVNYGAVKLGGRHYIQVSKISLSVDASRE